MRILITNDDGIHGVGLYHLACVARKFGEVKIVAPDRERSACGHSMTLRDPLRVNQLDFHGLQAFSVNGVPVDCVNIGLNVAWPDGCDLVLSGINAGPNLGFDVTYSGTAAGAMEGAINQIRSIAVSLATFNLQAEPHYETAVGWLEKNFLNLIEFPLNELSFLNVNVPSVPMSDIKGQKCVAMGRRVYQERIEKRDDPWGRPYFWQGGAVITTHDQKGTDLEAVSQGYVSLTPVTINWTDQVSQQANEAAVLAW